MNIIAIIGVTIIFVLIVPIDRGMGSGWTFLLAEIWDWYKNKHKESK